jgi:protein SCO1/2
MSPEIDEPVERPHMGPIRESRNPFGGYPSIGRNPWFWVAVAGLITMPLLRNCLRNVPDPPEVIGQIPEFSLVDQQGETFGSRDLAGDVYIAGFVFTSCQSVCPGLMESMSQLQDRYERGGKPVRLVMITVDPENDGPAELQAFGERFGADFERWRLLTGEPAEIRSLIVGGFMTDMGERTVDEANIMDISHGGRFAIVDGSGGLRGFYGTDETGIDEIYHRSLHVLRAQP